IPAGNHPQNSLLRITHRPSWPSYRQIILHQIRQMHQRWGSRVAIGFAQLNRLVTPLAELLGSGRVRRKEAFIATVAVEGDSHRRHFAGERGNEALPGRGLLIQVVHRLVAEALAKVAMELLVFY